MTLALLFAAIVLLLVDWRQTVAIFAAGRRELNPIIRWAHGRWGRHGVDLYFGVCIALALVVDAFYANAAAVLAVVAVVQLVVVVRNHRIGIRPAPLFGGKSHG